jgi:inositol phosphorylceramide mannosyltransferase catalytic subunit
MGAMPNHPLYLQVINNLKRYARNWGIPYLTIMLSTGPLFLSIMWKQYVQTLQNSDVGVAIMPEEWYVLKFEF